MNPRNVRRQTRDSLCPHPPPPPSPQPRAALMTLLDKQWRDRVMVISVSRSVDSRLHGDSKVTKLLTITNEPRWYFHTILADTSAISFPRNFDSINIRSDRSARCSAHRRHGDNVKRPRKRKAFFYFAARSRSGMPSIFRDTSEFPERSTLDFRGARRGPAAVRWADLPGNNGMTYRLKCRQLEERAEEKWPPRRSKVPSGGRGS